MSNSTFNHLLRRYVFGLIAAMSLSVMAYLIIVNKWFDSAYSAMTVLLILASIQLVIQLVCFLHLDGRGRSRSRAMALGFTLLMMFVVVVGSIWIMDNLDYRMGMSADRMEQYMQEQNKKGF